MKKLYAIEFNKCVDSETFRTTAMLTDEEAKKIETLLSGLDDAIYNRGVWQYAPSEQSYDDARQEIIDELSLSDEEVAEAEQG